MTTGTTKVTGVHAPVGVPWMDLTRVRSPIVGWEHHVEHATEACSPARDAADLDGYACRNSLQLVALDHSVTLLSRYHWAAREQA